MLRIQDIKDGDVFYECSYGKNHEYVAISGPYKKYVGEDNEGWAINARCVESGREDYFFSAERYSAYAPKLYSEPQY